VVIHNLKTMMNKEDGKDKLPTTNHQPITNYL